MRFQLVVEGHGEQGATGLLLRRVFQERMLDFEAVVLKPQRRRGIDALLARKGDDLVRYQRVAECDSDAVLWLLDHDDGCLVESLRIAHGKLDALGVRRPTAFAFIPREYETLFLEAPSCCESYYGIEAEKFAAGKGVRDAKGHISQVLPSGSIYKPTTDQTPLTARLDLDVLHESSASFRHLERVVRWLRKGQAGLYPI